MFAACCPLLQRSRLWLVDEWLGVMYNQLHRFPLTAPRYAAEEEPAPDLEPMDGAEMAAFQRDLRRKADEALREANPRVPLPPGVLKLALQAVVFDTLSGTVIPSVRSGCILETAIPGSTGCLSGCSARGCLGNRLMRKPEDGTLLLRIVHHKVRGLLLLLGGRP